MKYTLLTVAAIALLGTIGASAKDKTLLDLAREKEAKVAAAQAALDTAKAAAAKSDPPGTIDSKLTGNLTKAQSNAIDHVATLIGPNWREDWAASKLPDPDDLLADRYMATPFDMRSILNNHAQMIVQSISPMKRMKLLDFIAAKPTLSPMDVEVIRYAGIHCPAIAARMDDIAKFLASGGIRGEEYYQFRNTSVLCRPGKWMTNMKVSEWIDLSMQPAHFSPATFTAGRDKIMLKLARLLIEKRQAQGLPTEGAEFDAAFAPVAAALKKPKFSGLREIVTRLDLQIPIPTDLDWTAQEAVAAVVQDAAERNGTFLTSWGASVPYAEGLGSVMFIKGEAAYETWRRATIAND